MNSYVDDNSGNGDTISFTRVDSMNVVAVGGVTPPPGVPRPGAPLLLEHVGGGGVAGEGPQHVKQTRSRRCTLAFPSRMRLLAIEIIHKAHISTFF